MNNYPDIIPVFPLSGVIFFPKTNLPLNIFEERYLSLVNDAFNKDKLMGMVQSQISKNEVYKVGCLGKISDLQKTNGNQNTDNLMEKIKIFFKRNGLLLNWKEFEKLDKTQQINTLSMISPITNEEKQKLLEAVTFEDKMNSLENIISFYLHENNSTNQTIQ